MGKGKAEAGGVQSLSILFCISLPQATFYVGHAEDLRYGF